MKLLTALAFTLVTCVNSGSVLAQAPSADEATSLRLGTALFDGICRASLGNPDKFHSLVGASGLTRLPQDQAPEGETWAGQMDGVSVAVQYTKAMTCFVYMSHAREQDVRLHAIKLIKDVFRQGDSKVVEVPSASKDSSVLRFNVIGPTGKYMLMALYRAGEPSLARSALVIGPFQ